MPAKASDFCCSLSNSDFNNSSSDDCFRLFQLGFEFCFHLVCGIIAASAAEQFRQVGQSCDTDLIFNAETDLLTYDSKHVKA